MKDVVEVMARAMDPGAWDPASDGLADEARAHTLRKAGFALAALEVSGLMVVPRETFRRELKDGTLLESWDCITWRVVPQAPSS